MSKLRLVNNPSRWLEHQGLGVEALDEPRIEAFLLTRGPRCVRRGGEVAAMTLDALDWDADVVSVSGKGQRHEALPLPREAGETLAAYLCDGRLRCSTRRLFVRVGAEPPWARGPRVIS